MKNLGEKVLNWFPLSRMHLFWKRDKGKSKAKVETSINGTMITPVEDLSPKGETSSAFIVRKLVM